MVDKEKLGSSSCVFSLWKITIVSGSFSIDCLVPRGDYAHRCKIVTMRSNFAFELLELAFGVLFCYIIHTLAAMFQDICQSIYPLPLLPYKTTCPGLGGTSPVSQLVCSVPRVNSIVAPDPVDPPPTRSPWLTQLWFQACPLTFTLWTYIAPAASSSPSAVILNVLFPPTLTVTSENHGERSKYTGCVTIG